MEASLAFAVLAMFGVFLLWRVVLCVFFGDRAIQGRATANLSWISTVFALKQGHDFPWSTPCLRCGALVLSSLLNFEMDSIRRRHREDPTTYLRIFRTRACIVVVVRSITIRRAETEYIVVYARHSPGHEGCTSFGKGGINHGFGEMRHSLLWSLVVFQLKLLSVSLVRISVQSHDQLGVFSHQAQTIVRMAMISRVSNKSTSRRREKERLDPLAITIKESSICDVRVTK